MKFIWLKLLVSLLVLAVLAVIVYYKVASGSV